MRRGPLPPPAPPSVPATTACFGTVPRRRTVVSSPLGKRPAGLGEPPAGITQASYVFPLGAAERPVTGSVAGLFGLIMIVKECVLLDWFCEAAMPTPSD